MTLDWNRGALKAIKVTGMTALLIFTALIGALIAGLVAIAGVIGYSLLTTGSTENAEYTLINAMNSLAFITADAILQNIVFVAVAVVFILVVSKQRLIPREPSEKVVASAAKWFVAGIAIDAVFAIAYVLFITIAGVSNVKTSGLSEYGSTAVAVSLVTFFVLSLFVGIGEEMLFRRGLQNYLTGQYGVAVALAVTSFIFAIMHTISQPQPLAIAGIFLVSIILGYMYYITGSIWMPIGFHFFEDFIALGFIPMGKPYFGGSPLFIFTQAKDVVLFGINLGPEDNLISIVLGLILLAGLYYWHQQRKKRVKL